MPLRALRIPRVEAPEPARSGSLAASRGAIAAALVVLHLAFFAPALIGRVVFPNDNSLLVGAPPSQVEGRRETLRFSDQNRQFVPTLHLHLAGPRDGWISTWDPHVQLGRPTTHVSGTSLAYPPTLLASWFSHDAFHVYTWLVAFTALVGLLGAYAFLCELGLPPLAAAAGATLLALGVFASLWSSFVMFPATLAWTAVLLAAVARFSRRPAAGSWLLAAFATYALLLSGYPQQIVHQAYVVVAFTLARCVTAPRGARLRPLAGLGAAAAVGVLAAAPVYLDLLEVTRRSTRLAIDAAFFTEALTVPGTLAEYARYVGTLVDAFWSGHPLDPEYPFRVNGVSLTPVGAGLLAAGLAFGLRRGRALWYAALGFFAVLALCPPAYRFAIQHLGFHLSRSTPLVGALVPAAVLVALAAADLIEDRTRRLPAALLALVPLLALGAWAAWVEAPLLASGVGLSIAATLGVAAFAWTGRRAVLAGLAVLMALGWSARLPLWRARDEIVTSSRLVDELRRRTSDGSRYAVVGYELPALLLPNVEDLIGLRSIHSYDSLSSAAYQRFTDAVSAVGAQVGGRVFARVADESRLGADELADAGVQVLISDRELASPLVEATLRYGPLTAYRFVEEPVLEAQLASNGSAPREWTGPLRRQRRLPVRRELDRVDRLEFAVSPDPGETTLVVSQQHHPAWRAAADGQPAEVFAADDLWLGVVVPPGTERIELRFRPWVRWAWLPQLLFAAAALLLVARRVLRRPDDPAPAASPGTGASVAGRA